MLSVARVQLRVMLVPLICDVTTAGAVGFSVSGAPVGLPIAEAALLRLPAAFSKIIS